MLPLPFVQRGWQLWLVAAALGGHRATVVVYNITQVSFRQLLVPGTAARADERDDPVRGVGDDPDRRAARRDAGRDDRVRPTLWVAVVGSALAFLPVFFSPLRTMRELPTEYEPAGAESHRLGRADSGRGWCPARRPARPRRRGRAREWGTIASRGTAPGT